LGCPEEDRAGRLCALGKVEAGSRGRAGRERYGEGADGCGVEECRVEGMVSYCPFDKIRIFLGFSISDD
jgi:hypothetical protein